MRTLYLDCFSGISGDMMVGALLDLGLPMEVLERELGRLELSGYHLSQRRGMDGALSGTDFHVDLVETEGHAAPRDRARAPRQPSFLHHSHGPGVRLHHSHAHPHAHPHEHPHPHAHPPPPQPPPPHEHVHPHPHEHAHEHVHPHPHEHAHEHVHPHPHEHVHEHAHDDAHRSWSSIRLLIEASSLPTPVKETSIRIFSKLAEAEGRIHHMPAEDVSFHEVGALDSIVDIVGSAIGLHHLGIEELSVSALPLGQGMVDCQHGRLPLPAPATLELLRGFPVYDAGPRGELVTPTGAAIVAALAQGRGAFPTMTVERVGYGLGKRRGHAIPNALRAVMGQSTAARSAVSLGQIFVIEANVDDMSPQLLAPLTEQALALGALDVAVVPIQMKKGRSGFQIQIMCETLLRTRLIELLMRESTSIGVRYYPVEREVLEREIESIGTPFGPIRVKVCRREGEIWNVMPEFEDCRAAAVRHQRPLKEVHQVAMRYALEALEPQSTSSPPSRRD